MLQSFFCRYKSKKIKKLPKLLVLVNDLNALTNTYILITKY